MFFMASTSKGYLFPCIKKAGFSTCFFFSISEQSGLVLVRSLSFSGCSALRTSLRFVFKPFFLIEFLFAYRKSKFTAAVFAFNFLVFHIDYLLN